MKTIHKQYCRFCKKKEGHLMKQSNYSLASGAKVQQYSCRPCNTSKKKEWYSKSPDAKQKQYELNKKHRLEHPERYAYNMAKYWARKAGYRLVKLSK